MQTLEASTVDLPALLEYAPQNGGTRVPDGQCQVFRAFVEPERSPLDVPGVDVELTTAEILDIIREMRSAGYEDAGNALTPTAAR